MDFVRGSELQLRLRAQGLTPVKNPCATWCRSKV